MNKFAESQKQFESYLDVHHRDHYDHAGTCMWSYENDECITELWILGGRKPIREYVVLIYPDGKGFQMFVNKHHVKKFKTS